MQKIKSLVLFLFIITTATVSCQSNDNTDDNSNITVEQLKTEMTTDTNLVILDVRTPQELFGGLGQIKGVINIPVQVLSQRINELDKYKDKNIAVICRSGNRSVMATKIMQAKGFKAKNVLGGMQAYNKQ
ncbi:MAG: rhodanese-like domain-containing protein [Ignavibacteriales bacterium]|nr:rhodanese-like domain-containing protein [Ignavibacteriales bacterium]